MVPWVPPRLPMDAAAPARSSVAASFNARVPATGPLLTEPSCNVPELMLVVPSRSLPVPERSRVPAPNLVRPLA